MSPKMKHGYWVTTKKVGKNSVTLNKKKDTLKEDFVSSGANFEENLRKAVKSMKKELDDRKACFIASHNEVYDEGLTPEDIEDSSYNELLDLCELYHRLRAGKRILK